MNSERPLTNATVIFIPEDSGTRVVLIHTGWGHTDEWEQARQWFEMAWKKGFEQLEKIIM